MCANIIPPTCQWTCWCNLLSGRGTSVADASRNKRIERPDGPRPIGYVALLGQRRGNT